MGIFVVKRRFGCVKNFLIVTIIKELETFDYEYLQMYLCTYVVRF